MCPPPDPGTGATAHSMAEGRERGEGHEIRGKHEQGSGHRTQLQRGNPARLVREGTRDDTSPKQVLRDTQNTNILTHLGFTDPNSS